MPIHLLNEYFFMAYRVEANLSFDLYTGEDYCLHARTLKNAKILKIELDEIASRCTHFELKTALLMKINFHDWLETAWHRLQCIFIILWK